MVKVDKDDLEDAMMAMDGSGDAEAWVSRQSGDVIVRFDMDDEEQDIPDDIDDDNLYVAVPAMKSLDLGQALVFDFVDEHLSDAEDEVRQFFRRPGAYRRFSDLVDERRLTERWNAFRNARTLTAMRAWCEDNGLQLSA